MFFYQIHLQILLYSRSPELAESIAELVGSCFGSFLQFEIIRIMDHVSGYINLAEALDELLDLVAVAIRPDLVPGLVDADIADARRVFCRDRRAGADQYNGQG